MTKRDASVLRALDEEPLDLLHRAHKHDPNLEGDELLGVLRAELLKRLDREVEATRGGLETKVDVSDAALVRWAEEELGVVLRGVPKVLAAFLFAVAAFRERRTLRMLLLGPRGGGKTKLLAVLELIAYRFFGYDAHNMGGSLEQAQRCFAHLERAHVTSRDLQSFTSSITGELIRSRRGGRIGISSASQKSVRGAHPIGPSGGGLLVLDEAALITDKLTDAAQGMLTGANPSAQIQASTMGEEPSGRFFELIQDPKAKNYQLFDYDVFDIAKRCPYDCATTCPVKEHFAQDYHHDLGGGEKQFVHKAYCGGRAHHVNGWVPIDEVAQSFRDVSRETFEREWLGWAAHRVGKVYDPVLLQQRTLVGKSLAANPADHAHRFLRLEKVVGIDWGFSGESCVCYLVRLRDALLVYRWEFFTGERFQAIREHVLARCDEEHIDSIACDAANPSDNLELATMAKQRKWSSSDYDGPRVRGVAFSKWKRYGVGEVRRRLEKELLFFAETWGGVPTPGHERAMRYLKAYHTDKNGDPVKEDDHGPDALLCGVVSCARNFEPQARLVG